MKALHITMLCACNIVLSLSAPAETKLHTRSWSAGTTDINGIRMTGTEIIKITNHKGKLFAGTSMWMESDASLGGCQILIKESARDPWKVDHAFGSARRRLTSLVSLTFSTDYKGKSIKPVPVLLAASTARKGTDVNIYRREDSSEKWVPMSLGTAPGASQVRAMGFYKDRVTGVEHVFAGVSGTKNSSDSLGLITGVFKNGRLIWSKVPELKLPSGERFMEFTECNNRFYASSSQNIWKRTDGPNPKWSSIFNDPTLSAPVGIRGLATVPRLKGQGEELIFITWAKIRRLNPDNNRTTIELDIPEFLTKSLNMPIKNALAGYNKIVKHQDPSGEDTWLVGFQCNYDPRWIKRKKPEGLKVKIRDDGKRSVVYFAIEARYLVRKVKDGNVAYEVRTINDPSRSKLGAVRTIALSPFPEDKERVLYTGGVDCNGIPHHDTGWIYRIEESQSLKESESNN